jgi:hypothetical protein
MDKVRFEVTLNGERLCTAGFDGYGTLTAGIVMCALRAADSSATKSTPQPVKHLLELFLVGVESNDSTKNKPMSWLDRGLNVGNEVGVRVLPDGEHDPPTETFPNMESCCPWKAPAGSAIEQIPSTREDQEPQSPPCSKNRLEILHNGTRLCIAGLYEEGMVGVTILATTRHPDHAKKLLAEGKPSENYVQMTVVGLEGGSPALREGDEILVRVLPPGECDPPVGPISAGSLDWFTRISAGLSRPTHGTCDPDHTP